MPLYEYECQQCHKRTEKRQKFSDPEITECPFCGGPLERVISAPAFSFAGGGWYKDLYSSAKPAAAGGSSGEGAASGGESKGSSEGAGGGSAEKPAAASPAPAPAAASAPTASSSEKK